MAINKVVYDGNTLIDLTGDTATASDVASGKLFHLADGTIATGTASGGGGASSWTKIAEKEFAVSTTSTSAGTVETWATGHNEIWTSDKWVYVRTRDTAGKRAGYFYGSDNFFLNQFPANGSGNTSSNVMLRYVLRYGETGFGILPYSGSTGYGVYADTIYADGRIRIRRRYSENYSSTIDGTYKVEVYLLDPAGGVLPFA